MALAATTAAFDLNDYTEYLDLNRFQYCFVSYSGGVLAIATDTSLILTDDANNNGNKINDKEETRLVLEFNEDSGRATCLQWIIEGAVVSVGFESGLLVCFNCKGEEIFEFKGNSTSVQSIKVASTEVHKNEASIWILYEGGCIVSFPVSHLENQNTNIASYRLSNHALVNDFVFLPSVYKASIFDLDEYDQQNNNTGSSASNVFAATGSAHTDKNIISSPNTSKKSHKRTPSHNVTLTKDLLSIFTAGKESTLAVYNLGAIVYNETDKNINSVRESTVNILSKGVMSLYNSLYGSTDTAATTVYKPDHQRVQESLITVTAKVEFKDTKRRVLKLSADPTGLYIVCSDILGRVLLFATHICAVVRIWKGLRHAELAWTTRMDEHATFTEHVSDNVADSSSIPNSANASLVIHAPLLGLVYIYRVPHGECIRIVPVGLNCHILSMHTPLFSDGTSGGGEVSHASGVLAYLLKPHADTGTLELTEIRPSDRTDADLDVRLTLVGEDDYGPGGDREEEEENAEATPYDNEALDFSSKSTDDATSSGTATTTIPTLNLPTLKNNHGASPMHSSRDNNYTATDLHAMRNIEQSLKLLVDCIPMSTLYSHLYGTGGNNSTNSTTNLNAYLPLDKEAFNIEVQRAEESILETLTAHRSVLSLSSLYKCVCLIESVELFGTLQPPAYATTTDTTTATSWSCPGDCDIHTLIAKLRTINTNTTTVSDTTADSTANSAANAFLSEQSAASLQSLASNDSQANPPTVGDTISFKKSILTKLAAGLLRYPVFSVQLHLTLLSQLDIAVKHHANKYQYDIHTGTITHLPAPILEYVTAELPFHLQLLKSYSTLRDICDATVVHSDCVFFSTVPLLNIRSMFERPAPTTASLAINSLNNTLLGMNSSTTQGTAARSSSPVNANANSTVVMNHTTSVSAAGKSITDEIAAIVKGVTLRSEAAMWALRVAQNEEMRVASKKDGATAESNSDKHDRISSADSASSYRSLPSNLYDTSGNTVSNTPATATPNNSISADQASVDLANIGVSINSHSKVKRIGHSSTPPRSPMDVTTDSNLSVPTLRRNFSNGNLFRKGSRSSLTNVDAANNTAEHEYTLSFSAFRAFVSLHRPLHSLPMNNSSNAIASEMYHYYSPLPPTLRMTHLLGYIAKTERFYFGNLQSLLDTIASVYDKTTAGAAGGLPRSPDARSSLQNASIMTVTSEEDATSAMAKTLLPALTLSEMTIEAFKVNTTSSKAKATTKDGAVYAPNIAIPHALLHTLVTPLLGDVFSLSNYTTALTTLGIQGIITPIMHVSPLLAAHIAHQNSSFLLTDLLCKKLSVFPYQRWLRDSLLTFQDALSVHMNNVFSASANRNLSVDTSTGGSFRVNVTSSAEKDARDIMHLNRLNQHSSGDNLYSRSFTNSNTSLDANGTTDEATDTFTSSEICTLIEEIRRVNRRTIEVISTDADVASGVNVLRINSMEQAIPSYNDFVGHILRPAYLYCTSCPNLEAVLVFATIVLETLQIANEQVERRTYGAMSLASNSITSSATSSVDHKNNHSSSSTFNTSSAHAVSSGTVSIWEGLIKQTRVALLLQSRKGLDSGTTRSGVPTSSQADAASEPFTPHSLSTGLISTHRLLAADTLAFALRAEQALEHEDKCREVYNRSIQSTAVGSTGIGQSGAQPSTTAKAEVLLAYGNSADKRWKDLLSVAVAEDAMTATNQDTKSAQQDEKKAAASEEQKRSVRKRRPLLLYFPAHSQPHYLGAYRSILLTERWFVAIQRVEVLVSAVQHLFSLPTHTYRPAVAAYLYAMLVFPVVQMLTHLEQDCDLFAWVSSGQSLKAYAGLAVKVLSDEQVQNLLKLMADNRLLKAFVNAGAELLGYIETALQAPPNKQNLSSQPSTTAASATSTHTTTTTSNNKHFLWQQPHVQHALALHSAAEHRSVYHNEATNVTCWPSAEDAFVNTLLLRFVEQSAGPYDAPHINSSSSTLWSMSLLSEHISRLWTLHIRSLCGLKSIKPTQIMGERVLNTMQAFLERYYEMCSRDGRSGEDRKGNTKASTGKSGDIKKINISLSSHFTVSDTERMEFLSQCLRKMVHIRQPTGVVYVLVHRWLTMQTHHSNNNNNNNNNNNGNNNSDRHSSHTDQSAVLTMDSVRLQHLHILLAAGGGSRDEEAEQMVHQITQTDLVLDTLIEALRARLGGILSAIDQLPSFGPLIAAMDAEAVVWARSSVSNTQPVVGGSIDVIKSIAGAVDAGSELAAICKSLNVNIASTRHLIICVQSTLMNVPINMRTMSDSGAGSQSSTAASSVKTSWFERKTKCDALLTLCKYFAQQLAQNK